MLSGEAPNLLPGETPMDALGEIPHMSDAKIGIG
jgi:hypothetical protein